MVRIGRTLIALAFALNLVMCSIVVAANSIQINVGDYFVIGKYQDKPIIWRCIGDDDNGKLLISDKILDYKPFNYSGQGAMYTDRAWENSLVRTWLNSEAESGQIQWAGGLNTTNYDSMAGFLSNGSFTQAERNLMKHVTQWTMLDIQHIELSTNGLVQPYNTVKEVIQGSPHDGGDKMVLYGLEDVPNIYYGAAYQLQDTVFLIDELQLYQMWKNFGTIAASCTEYAAQIPVLNDSYRKTYWLRTPLARAFGEKGYGAISDNICQPIGIRPAFYLNEAAFSEVTGSGTIDNPYILTQNSNYISVLKGGQPISFDVAPIMENDRVLVPFRAIFEAFGAEVGWNGDTSTVTATTKSTTLTLQIGCYEMTVNGETVTLDVPPQLVDDRTLVPIRAVSEGLGANVQWDDANKTVIITSK